MVAHAAENNGRIDFMVLKDHYKSVGAHAVNAVQADKVLIFLNSGKKKPHMWWDEFGRQLTYAFNIYDHLEKRRVHSNDTRLHILNRKILADLLQATKESINLELTKTPVTITYEHELAAFRNPVNHKFPAWDIIH